MNKDILVSIITVVYNNRSGIEECIESVSTQSYQNVEHIVIDGGSTDGTREYLKEMRSLGRISTLISEPDKGLYDAINKGIELVQGEIFGLLHSDDLFASPDVLTRLVETFETSDAEVVYGDVRYVTNDDEMKTVRLWKAGLFKPYKIKLGWMPPHPTIYCRSAVKHIYGPYNLSFKISADYEAVLRLLSHNLSIAYLPIVMLDMRVGGNSNKLSHLPLKYLEDFRALRKNGWNYLSAVLTVMLKTVLKVPQFFTR